MTEQVSCLRGIRYFSASALCGRLQLSLLLLVHTTVFHSRHSSTAAPISLSLCHLHHGIALKDISNELTFEL
jgi:hypothetical protein